MSRCVIISACPVSPELAEALRPDDFIIACDAGYRNCAPLGRRPNIIVGDFDTAPCPEQQDDDIIVLPHVKDDTDTQYAAHAWLLKHGYDEIQPCWRSGRGTTGAHAGQPCHRTVSCQKRRERPAGQRAQRGAVSLCRAASLFCSAGTGSISPLFPMEGRLTGVCIRGAFYPLENAVLTADYPLGVSNEFIADTAQLQCSGGCGLVVLTRDDA